MCLMITTRTTVHDVIAATAEMIGNPSVVVMPAAAAARVQEEDVRP